MTGPPIQPSLKVLKQLSSDALSEAFLAQVGGFASPMVVRLVSPALAQDLNRMSRFIADAQLMASISAAALLQVRSAGLMSDGRVYVLTDFAAGEPLAGQAPLTVEALVDVGEQLAGAIKALHDSGLVLGAVPADAVVLTADGPKLDPSLAMLSRAPGTTIATDVKALAALLGTLAGTGGEKNAFESAVRRGLTDATTAADLLSAFAAVRQRWGSDTRVSSKRSAGGTLPEAAGQEPDLTGKRLGPYELKRMLGEGAMGRVYLGKHNRIGREAAIKVLKAEHAKDKDLVLRFIQEATAVSAIKNEHIVEIHDFGEELAEDGTPLVYCVMEVLHGRALADEIKLGRMGVQRACRITQQVARALGAAHALGVVHRDVKPENIFLHRRDGDSDYVKVLDFGVAKLLKPMEGMTTSRTQAGMIIGTPDYMAPEQALGTTTDLRIDLYAVGLVLYELLAGERPFHGDSFVQLVVEITTKAPPPLPARTPSGEPMPAALGAIVARCLEKKPEDRWKDAAELCAALEPFVHSGHTVPGLPAVVVEEQPPRRRGRALAAVALVAALGAGGVWAWQAGALLPLVTQAPVEPPVVTAPVVPEPIVPVPAPVEPPPPVVVAPVVPVVPEPPVAAPIVKAPPPAATLKRLTGKDVARVFAGSQKKLRRCLEDHRSLLPSKEGELMLTFTVRDSGAVSKAKLSTPGFEGVIGNCVVSRLKDLRFPRTLEPEVTFELPLAYVIK